jgi:hypothetical protein
MILDIKLVCPKCGCESPFKSFQVGEEILEISRLAAKFGKNWPWTEEYLRCFQVDHSKPLKPARMKIILEELLRFIDQTGFNIEKHWYTIRPDALFAAIRHVAQTNKIGFKNHNYLKKVAIDFNLKMIQKEEGDQKKREDEAFRRERRDPNAPQRLKEIMDSIK